MLWKILADLVTGLHLLLIGFFAVSAVLLAVGFFKNRRNWKIFYWVFIAVAVGLQILLCTKILKSCPLTDLEYWIRRHYDTSESWLRTRSLLATSIYNVTGIVVPEYALTIVMGIALAVMIISLVLWKPKPGLRTS
jgi:tellurite resistance protein TehA-like permease